MLYKDTFGILSDGKLADGLSFVDLKLFISYNGIGGESCYLMRSSLRRQKLDALVAAAAVACVLFFWILRNAFCLDMSLFWFVGEPRNAFNLINIPKASL